jgi:hypothetical protein
VICADESERYVVRVFVGLRGQNQRMLPPWRECLIFGVRKDGDPSAVLVEDARYQPVLR